MKDTTCCVLISLCKLGTDVTICLADFIMNNHRINSSLMHLIRCKCTTLYTIIK